MVEGGDVGLKAANRVGQLLCSREGRTKGKDNSVGGGTTLT